MAIIVAEVVASVLAAVESEAGPQLVAGWSSERYRELTNRARFRHLLRNAELILPAVQASGLVTVTAGASVVVGDATARAAWAADVSAVIGRYFRVDGQRNWFRVAGLTGSNDLQLESHYVSPFSTAGSPLANVAYKLVARFHSMPADLRHIGVFSHPRLLQPLDEISHQEMDEAMTARVLVADVPKVWCERGAADDGRKLIEIYPFAKTEQLVPFTYYSFSPALTLESLLPTEIDLHVLKAGVLVDVYRWEMSQAMKRNQPEVAATWRNEMRAQMTTWDEKIREAVKADRAGDTLSFQMNTRGFSAGGDRRIRTAFDYVWNKGSRP